jgi:uncharacterized protein (DUF2345 family)
MSIKAMADVKTTVAGKSLTMIGGNSTSVTSGKAIIVGAGFEIGSRDDFKLFAGGSKTENVSGSSDVIIGGGLTSTSGSSTVINAGGDATIAASRINLN